MSDDLRNATLLDLFRMETETQAQVLGDGLLALERTPTDASRLEACMRAAHSLKGAARIVGVDAGVAHLFERQAHPGRAMLDRFAVDVHCPVVDEAPVLDIAHVFLTLHSSMFCISKAAALHPAALCP